MSTRAEQRRLRQLEIENEQRLEDVEALKMTEEQRDILLRTFQSVKFEFHDLDGLSWTDPIRQQLNTKQPEDVARAVSQYKDDQDQQQQQPSFVVLTKAELAAFSPEETIRISAVRRSRSPEPGAEPLTYTGNKFFPLLKGGKRDGTRARSPIKGLFTPPSDDATPYIVPGDHCSSCHVDDPITTVETTFSKTDDQATIRLRELPEAVAGTAVAALDHLAKDSSHSSASPFYCDSSSKVSPSSPPPSTYHLQPFPAPIIAKAATGATGAGIITSIFRSPVFTVPKGRMRSQVQCSVASTPTSSPSLASICSFSSP